MMAATGRRLAGEIPAQRETIIPAIVQLELAKWLTRERTEEDADRFIAYSMKCVLAPLDTAIALRAAECSALFKLPTADAIVYATALHFGADLLTCDAHFEGLNGVLLIKK